MADDAPGAAETFQAGQGAGEIGSGGRGAVGGQALDQAAVGEADCVMAGLTCFPADQVETGQVGENRAWSRLVVDLSSGQ